MRNLLVVTALVGVAGAAAIALHAQVSAAAPDKVIDKVITYSNANPPPKPCDRARDVTFKSGGKIVVKDGLSYCLNARKIIVEDPNGALIDGTGNAETVAQGPGPACPNCNPPTHKCASTRDYQSDINGCINANPPERSADNGLVRQGNQGGRGADITVKGAVTPMGKLKCVCVGGHGGPGGVRGTGMTHVDSTNGGNVFTCPGDPHKKDVGPDGPPGTNGTCACP